MNTPNTKREKQEQKINLFISWFNSPDKQRGVELLKILELNKGANRFLVSEHPFINIPEGVKTISVLKRPTYTDIFDIANEYADENTITIIANADIEFDSTALRQISNINYSNNRVLAITRWEKDTGNIVNMKGLTQDAWIYKGKITCKCDVFLGLPSCDHIICWELAKKYDVRNPSLDIKIWHYESVKTWSKVQRVRGMYLAVKPEKITDMDKKDKRKKKLIIIQPGHFGDIIICLPIAKHYSKEYDVYWQCPVQYHDLFRNVNYAKPVTFNHRGDYDVIIDLSFGLSKGDVQDWWAANKDRFNSFIEAKYELAELPVSTRWALDIWHDKNKEKALFRRLGLNGKKYALCHEKSNYDKRTAFQTNLPKVLFRPIPGFNIFDWYEVIINASEIHCIDSSLANYVEVLPEAKDIPKTIAEGINGGGVLMSVFNNNWTAYQKPKFLIAADIKPDGVVASGSMKRQMANVIRELKPSLILETGTHTGLGSTKAILDTIQQLKLNTKVISIECNPLYVQRANENLKRHPKKSSLEILCGISVPEGLLPDNVSYEGLPEGIIVDHVNPNEYLKETVYEKDNLMKEAIDKYGFPELVILDSAGHMGTIEFDYLMSLMEGHSFTLIIDDTKHLKHFRTLEKIKVDESFELLIEGQEKFGYAIARHTAKVHEEV